MTLRSMLACESKSLRYTTRDSLIGAVVMIAATLVLAVLGVALKRAGWTLTGEMMVNLAFFGSFTISMPFWLMKGQPRKAQAVIVGGTLALLVAINYVALMV